MRQNIIKTTLIKTILVILFLLAGSSAPVLADGPGIPPFCPPGQACDLLPLAHSNQVLHDGGGMPPFCPPGQVCN